MRFLCDEDVDSAVAARLRSLGHDAWTVYDAGLSGSADDELTVYASNKGAVLLTHDKEFSKRRRRNVVGQHVQLRCIETEAADLLAEHLDEIVRLLESTDDIFVLISKDGMDISRSWK